MGWITGRTVLPFGDMALEVFRHQFAENAPYRNYCLALGRDPSSVDDWRVIPALPTDAFKFPAHLPRGFPAERATRHFLTSGTTTEVRGRHEFEDLDLYHASILSGWRELRLPEIPDPWFYSQCPADAPESSLVDMFGMLGAGAGEDCWLISAEGVPRYPEIGSAGPVQLFSTAIGLLRWMESGPRRALPEGSWIFETGGYKGLTDTLDPAEFRSRVAGFFGVPENRILNEYSMTELSSQFYRWPDEPGHRGPSWTRIRVTDPETGRPAAEGEVGYLEIIDLANLGSVAAIRTQDLAIARGDSSFTLLGRDPGALPRGCSRGTDDLLRAR